MRLDPEILDGPPETGARILALAALADAEDALARMADAPDREALPAFRTALRRLTGALRAGASGLAGAVPQERAVRLEALLRRATVPIDGEALAGWLEEVRGDLPGTYRGALDWLADRIEGRRRADVQRTAGEVERRFRRVAPRLRAELTARRGPPRPDAPATFGLAFAGALRARTRALRDAVLAVAGRSDAAGLARVRDEETRVGDLLAPLRGSMASAAASLDTLRPLHELLARWQRASAAEPALEAALLEARAEEARRGAPAIAGLRPGLLATLRLAQERAAAAYERIASEHLATKATAATDASYAVVAELEGGEEGADEGDGAATPRRFLVTGVPLEARGGEIEELEQGWLPGDGRESVGVARSSAGERWFRAAVPGRARPARVDPIARSEFEALWPLTDGHRIAKRRHLVAGSPGWRFEEYLDRSLVLAVAEEGDAAEPPWLEALLVREVSDERGYLDEVLARRPPRRAG